MMHKHILFLGGKGVHFFFFFFLQNESSPLSNDELKDI